MKEKIFTIRENFRSDDIEQRKKIIREIIIKIIKNQLEKEAQKFATSPEHSMIETKQI